MEKNKMKEGYLQMKIAEINDRCNKIDQMINMEKSKITLLEEQVGGFKELLKKLKDLDDIKKQTINIIKQENEKIMEKHIDLLSNKLSKTYKKITENKNKKIDEFLKQMNKTETQKKDEEIKLNNKINEINYLLEHNNLLMMKLANKGVLSQREIDEMNMRSNKKIKK